MKHFAEVVFLFNADAVFAGDGASHFGAHSQDASGQFFGAFQAAFFVTIKEDEGVKVAITCVEDVGDTDPCFE